MLKTAAKVVAYTIALLGVTGMLFVCYAFWMAEQNGTNPFR